MTDRTNTDVLIAGGGIAGLTATVAFASIGLDVVCVDPAPLSGAGTDLRSTTFFIPSINFLRRIGVWDALSHNATPLKIMRIADAGGVTNEIRQIADFNSAEIDQEAFGYNIPNQAIREVLLHHISNTSATLVPSQKVTRILARTNVVLINLENNQQISAKLVIAADGRNSLIREQTGIGLKRWQYGQKALVFNVTTAIPHDNISTEIHRSGGPFTMVPLPDLNGKNRCAVVWMEAGAEADRLHQLQPNEFTQAVNDRSCGVLGQLDVTGDRAMWPIISQRADRLSADRVALIAEAAHVIPPIGAQGLNMSLADINCLLDLVESASDIGAADLLKAYHDHRWSEMATRVKGVDMLNRAAMADNQVLRDIRVAGLRAIYGVTPMRHRAMKAGLGI